MAFYSSVGTKTNSFSNNVKTKLVAAVISDKMDYVKASVSKMPQSEFKGKKYGKSYKLYIPDVGKVVQGLTAAPDDITEVETEIKLDNYNTSVTIDAWNDLGNIETFKDQIAIPQGTHLARAVQKAIIDENVFKSMQAVVSSTASFGVLSNSSAALNELAIGGEIVSFMHPTVMGNIASGGLANFLPNDVMAKVYGENYLGQYAGAAQVQCASLPVVTTGATIAIPDIDLTAVTDSSSNTVGYETITELSFNSSSISNVKVGYAYKIAGLKIIDPSGLETDQDVVAIVQNVNTTTYKATISPLRIAVGSYRDGNPNCTRATTSTTLTITSLLSTSSTYYVGQVRTKDCLAYDAYKFENLPGSENEEVGVVGDVSVKMSTYGDGTNLTKLIRLDAPFAAGIWEPRGSVTVYIKK